MGWIAFLLIGLGAGVLSGLFGIGGGVVIVPALIYLARMQPQAATGTSLAALLLPVGALGAWEYYRHGNLEVGAGLVVALGLFLGAGIGAKLSLELSPTVLRRAFAVFLALIAIRMWFD
ncbi:MAG: sulfite exporter TauE/SafE family protein [Longimicrobiaceae bacterium]